MSSPSSAAATAAVSVSPGIPRRIVWLMGAACALIVANLYYLQPMLADVARSVQASESQVGIVATLAQVGYALGMLLLVPLGDALNRRTLIVASVLAVALALMALALAPNLVLLGVASLLVGVFTIGAQIIVPFAASLARPEERGRVIGTVMSGLLIGILLARTVSGLVSEAWGWRAMFWLAAATMLVLSVALRFSLPADAPRGELRYSQLLGSLWTLLRTQPVLREVSAFGGLAFGAFSAFWVTLVFHLELPPFQYGAAVAGLFGLVGVVGALAASVVGKLSDRMPARRISGITLTISLLSFVVFWLAGSWIWGLVVGVILLDLGVQATHISNQTRVFALIPEARSRLNTVYMVTYFVGGALGSTLGTFAWGAAGWAGVCFVGVVLVGAALLVYALGLRRR